MCQLDLEVKVDNLPPLCLAVIPTHGLRVGATDMGVGTGRNNSQAVDMLAEKDGVGVETVIDVVIYAQRLVAGEGLDLEAGGAVGEERVDGVGGGVVFMVGVEGREVVGLELGRVVVKVAACRVDEGARLAVKGDGGCRLADGCWQW